MTGVVKMSLDEYLELVQRQTRAETQLSTFCDMLLERAVLTFKHDNILSHDDEFIDQMLEEYGYDVKGRIEELHREDEKSLEPVTIPEGVDDDLPFA